MNVMSQINGKVPTGDRIVVAVVAVVVLVVVVLVAVVVGVVAKCQQNSSTQLEKTLDNIQFSSWGLRGCS